MKTTTSMIPAPWSPMKGSARSHGCAPAKPGSAVGQSRLSALCGRRLTCGVEVIGVSAREASYWIVRDVQHTAHTRIRFRAVNSTAGRGGNPLALRGVQHQR